jgi:signal transduction histidine kinase
MQDLLELSKHGVVANPDELVTVSKLIQKLVNSLPEAATISVESSIDSAAVRGDAQRLSIAVRNILDNAQKFAGNTQPLLVKH